MHISSVQNNNCSNAKQNFSGLVDKSVYKAVKMARNNVMYGVCQDETCVPAAKMLSEFLSDAVAQLVEYSKRLHPNTKIKLRSVVDPQDGKKYFLFQAQNKKMNKTLNIRRFEVSESANSKLGDIAPFDEMVTLQAGMKDLVKKVRPEDIDYTLFSATEKDFAKTSNKRSYGLIDRLFLRYKAKKLDKLAPEFHANPNVLKRLDARIKIIDKVNAR